MSPISLLVFAARGAIILGLALAAMPLLRRAAASTRRLGLALALGASLLLPLASRVAPAWPIVSVSELPLLGAPVAEPIAPSPTSVASPVEPRALEPAAPPARPAAGALGWTEIALGLWAFGALVIVARLAVGLARARGLARRAAPVDGWPIVAIAAAEQDAGARAAVRFSDEVDAPVVTGLIVPVVLVPRAALSWTPARWRVVLVHELAHVRQMDCLAQLVAGLASAVYWFNPLAWMAARRLRLERELAADELVLSTGARATAYAEHLLAIVAGAPARAPNGALAMAERSELTARIEAIVRPGAALTRRSRGRAALIAAVVTALLAVVACATPEDPRRAPEARAEPPSAAPARAPATLAQEVASFTKAPVDRVALTIDASLQNVVDEEMARLVVEWRPAAATAIVLDPSTGAVLALSDAATARRAYVPGSTFKAVTLAAALDVGAVQVTDRFDCGDGARAYGAEVLHDAAGHRWLGLPEVLAVSSNIGVSRVYDALGGARLGQWLKRFHFGEVPAIELPDAASGAVPASIGEGMEGAVVAIGEGITASPLQIAAVYGAIANDGVYNAPTLVGREPSRERVMRSETARAMMTLLERAVSDDLATGKAARVPGVRVAGKTGTGDFKTPGGEERYYASFVGAVPADKPRYVILVGADVPPPEAVGGKVAAPVFARIATRALAR